MSPEKGSLVRVFFNNQSQEDGVVISWSDDDRSELLLKNNDRLVILNTKENVFAVRVFNRNTKPLDNLIESAVEPVSVDGYYDSEQTRGLALTELYKRKAQMEREEARRHLTTFTPNNYIQQENYAIPKKLQSIPKYPQKKVRRFSR